MRIDLGIRKWNRLSIRKWNSVIALVFVFLLINTPFASAQLFNAGEEDVGEAIVINVEKYEPRVVVSSVLEERYVPVYAYLKGVSLGSLISGGESPESAPFYGLPKIKTITIRATDSGSYNYLQGAPIHVKPAGRTYTSDGRFVDLGYLIITLRQMKESEIPDRIDINLTAKIRFDLEYGFGEFGAEELFLHEYPDVDEWKSNKGEGEFWGGKGYVWATKIEDDRVSLRIYDSYLRSTLGSPVLTLSSPESGVMRGGGSNLYTDYFRVRLDGVDIPRDTAEVLVEIDGKIEKKILAKGERLFPGSEWYVKEIRPYALRKIGNDDKEVGMVELRHTKGYDAPIYFEYTEKESKCGNNVIDKNEGEECDGKLLGDGSCDKLKLGSGTLKCFAKGTDKECTYDKSGCSNYDKKSETEKENVKIINKEKGGVCGDVELVGDEELKNIEKIDWKRLYCTGIYEMEGFLEQYPNSGYKDEIYDALGRAYEEIGETVRAKDAFEKSKSPDAGIAANRLEKEIENGIVTRWFSLDVYEEEFEDTAKWGEDTWDTYSVRIKLLGINEVDKTDRGSATVVVKGENPERVYIGSDVTRDFVDKDKIKFKWVLDEIGSDRIVIKQIYDKEGKKEHSETIYIDKPREIESNNGGKTEIRVMDIDTKRVAKITILPGTGRAVSETEFSAHIPVEKRLIQFSPEQIDSQINKTEALIRTLDKTIDRLDKFLGGWKILCMTTFAAINIINLFKGTAVGKAREYVMKKISLDGTTLEGGLDKKFSGWSEYCSDDKVSGWGKIYKSYDNCIFANADTINTQMDDAKKDFNSMSDILGKGEKGIGNYVKDGVFDESKKNEVAGVVYENLKEDKENEVEGLTKEQIKKLLEHNDLSPGEFQNLLEMKTLGDKSYKDTLEYYVNKAEVSRKVDADYNKIVSEKVKSKNISSGNIDLSSEQKQKFKEEFKVDYDVWTNNLKLNLYQEHSSEDSKKDSIELDNIKSYLKTSLKKDDKKYDELIKEWDTQGKDGKIDGKIDVKTLLTTETTGTGKNEKVWSYQLKLVSDKSGGGEADGGTSGGSASDGSGKFSGLERLDLKVLKTADGVPFTDSSGKTIYYTGDEFDILEKGPGKENEFYVSENEFYAGMVMRNNYASDATAQFYDDGKPFCIPTKQSPSDGQGRGGNYIRVEKDGTTISLWNVGEDGKMCVKDRNGKDDDLIVMSNNELVLHATGGSNDKNRGLLNALSIEKNRVVGWCSEKDSGKILSFAGGVSMKCGFDAARVTDRLFKLHCTDVMGITECKILFNVCDPVMCPASRFDLGGRWPLSSSRSVVETGIIGSLILGLPNAVWNKGGTNIVPVCMTGISAGLKSWRSVFQGYRECLHASKINGDTVGICDRVRSVFVCELLWREALAILDTNKGVAGMVLDKFFGKRVSDGTGWEYSNPADFRSNLDNIGQAAKYFTQDYAQSAFAAYKARSMEEIGTTICKSAIFGKLPGIGDFIGELSKPESPAQFTAFFDEFEWSDAYRTTAGIDGTLGTASGVGQSRYSVYYHIYSGEDRDARYAVFLTDSPYAGEYVSGQNRVFITECKYGYGSRAFIPKGGYADYNCDFVARSGMKQVCIELNGRVECGFGKVSSSFGLNYLTDLMVQDEATKNINSAEDCVPSSARTTDALGSIILPGEYGLLSNTGIRRVCSIVNPGRGTNEVDWGVIGDCGNDKEGHYLGQCWIDRKSIDITDLSIKNETYGVLGDRMTEFIPDYEEKVKYVKSRFEALEKLYDAWVDEGGVGCGDVGMSDGNKVIMNNWLLMDDWLSTAKELVEGYREITEIGVDIGKSEGANRKIGIIYLKLAEWKKKCEEEKKVKKQQIIPVTSPGGGGRSDDRDIARKRIEEGEYDCEVSYDVKGDDRRSIHYTYNLLYGWMWKIPDAGNLDIRNPDTSNLYPDDLKKERSLDNVGETLNKLIEYYNKGGEYYSRHTTISSGLKDKTFEEGLNVFLQMMAKNNKDEMVVYKTGGDDSKEEKLSEINYKKLEELKKEDIIKDCKKSQLAPETEVTEPAQSLNKDEFECFIEYVAGENTKLPLIGRISGPKDVTYACKDNVWYATYDKKEILNVEGFYNKNLKKSHSDNPEFVDLHRELANRLSDTLCSVGIQFLVDFANDKSLTVNRQIEAKDRGDDKLVVESKDYADYKPEHREALNYKINGLCKYSTPVLKLLESVEENIRKAEEFN